MNLMQELWASWSCKVRVLSRSMKCIIEVRKDKRQDELFFKGEREGFSVKMKGAKGALQFNVGVIQNSRFLKRFTYWRGLLLT